MDQPVVPSIPSVCPTPTTAPPVMAGSMEARCPYRVVMPAPWSTMTWLPYPLPLSPAWVTVPLAAATTGLWGVARSTPLCRLVVAPVTGSRRIPNPDVIVYWVSTNGTRHCPVAGSVPPQWTVLWTATAGTITAPAANTRPNGPPRATASTAATTATVLSISGG